MGRAFEDLAQAMLAAQEDFEGDVLIDGRDQDPEIGKGFGIDQMGFVDDEEGGFFALVDTIEKLQEHAVFAHFGFFTELGNDESEKGVGIERCEMKV